MKRLSAIELVAVSAAVVAAAAATAQTYLVVRTLESPYHANLHGRRIDSCLALLEQKLSIESALAQYAQNWVHDSTGTRSAAREIVPLQISRWAEERRGMEYSNSRAKIDELNKLLERMAFLWDIEVRDAYSLRGPGIDPAESEFGMRIAEAYEDAQAIWLHDLDISPGEGMDLDPTPIIRDLSDKMDRVAEECGRILSGESTGVN